MGVSAGNPHYNRYQNNDIVQIGNNKIYKITDSSYSFELQFNQLITYFNFNKVCNYALSTGENPMTKSQSNNINNDLNSSTKIIFQNKLLLIDKNWINRWKKHVGYNEVKYYFKKNNLNRKLNVDDSHWIIPIIRKNSINNSLNPLDNSVIYDENNEIDPLADFEITDEKCFNLFITGAPNIPVHINYRFYPIQLLKNKIIIFLNNNIFLIKFKLKNEKLYPQIIIKFEKIGNAKINIINNFVNKDINDWLNELNFNIFSDYYKNYNSDDCEFVIKNKYLKKIQLVNNVSPLYNKNYLLNSINNLSKNTLISIQNEMVNNLKLINSNANLIEISQKLGYNGAIGKNKELFKNKNTVNNELNNLVVNGNNNQINNNNIRNNNMNNNNKNNDNNNNDNMNNNINNNTNDNNNNGNNNMNNNTNDNNNMNNNINDNNNGNNNNGNNNNGNNNNMNNNNK